MNLTILFKDKLTMKTVNAQCDNCSSYYSQSAIQSVFKDPFFTFISIVNHEKPSTLKIKVTWLET